MADLTARPDHWTDMLPGNWQQAINTNGILNALGRALSRQAPDMTRGIEHDQYGSVSDRNWLLQQAAGGPPKLNPLAAEMLDKGGILANFIGPGVKLPAAAPKPRFSGLPDHLAAPLLADDEWTRLLGNVPKEPTRIGNFNLIREPGWDRVHYGLVPEGVTSLWLPDGNSVPRIGRFQAKPSMNGGIEVTNAYIDQPYTGRGLGQQVYDTISADFNGVPVVPSSWNQLSPHAVKFWSKRDPEVLGRIRDIQRSSFEGDRYPERLIQASAPKPTGIRAYHGSPHDFNAERLVKFPDGRTEHIVGTPDRLPDIPFGAQVVKDFPLGRVRLDKIGTGEGAQAYGPGFYGAESEGVAKSYRDGLSRGTIQAGNRSIPVAGTAGPGSVAYQRQYGNMSLAERMLADHNGNFDRSIRDLMELASIKRRNPKDSFITETPEAYEAAVEQLKAMRSGEWAPPSQGRMYEVRINADPEQFLDWDKPLAQQPEARAILDRIRVNTAPEAPHDNPAVNNIRAALGQANVRRDDWQDAIKRPETVQALRDAGIPGVKYLDQGSRLAGEGSRNYVVFDDKLIEILRKYGLLPPVAAGTAAALNQQEPPL